MSHFHEMLDLWGEAMWRATWHGGLATLIVATLCWLWPAIPARFQCWLWRLVLLKFLVSLLWLAPIEIPLLPAVDQGTPVYSQPSSLFPWQAEASGLAIPDQSTEMMTKPVMFLFIGWFALCCWKLTAIWVAYRNAKKLRNRCSVCDHKQLHESLASVGKQASIASLPTLLELRGHGSPLLLGIRQPAIVFPSHTLEQLDAREQALVLGHELAHIERYDLLSNLVASVIRAVFFFHPLVWLSERRLCLAQEIAADELAISYQKQDPVRYASLLVSVIGKLGSRSNTPALSVGVAGSPHSLQQRISAMRFLKPTSPRNRFSFAILLGLAAIFCLVPWTIVATAAEQTEIKETVVNGKFLSYKDGILKIRTQVDQSDPAKEKEYEWKVAAETMVISHIRDSALPGTANKSFARWEPEALISVKLLDGKVTQVELGKIKSAEKTTEKTTEKSPDKTPDKAPAKTPDRVPEKSVPKEKTHWGKFVSFEDDTLTIQLNSGEKIVNKIPKNAQTLVWNQEENKYLPADRNTALDKAAAGTWTIVSVGKDSGLIRLGARKGSTTGTFISFKDDRLLMLGKDLGPSYTKKYGNQLHMNKFRNDVFAYESVDGGEYKKIGIANKVLGDVKEGTIITVHGEGDDNITLIQIGVPKKP
jgi:beta-lactamase regulating signal transducer with metallopeptidase domain